MSPGTALSRGQSDLSGLVQNIILVQHTSEVFRLLVRFNALMSADLRVVARSHGAVQFRVILDANSKFTLERVIGGKDEVIL